MYALERPHVTMAMVMSADGRTTYGARSAAVWSSPADQAHFARLKEKNDAIVMGRRTYEAVRSRIVPNPDKPRVVMTRTPKAYAHEETDGLTFTGQPPQQILGALAAADHKRVLLAGGSTANGLFLNAQCVDSIVMTVEPVLFGRGEPLVNALGNTAVSLRLQDVQRLGAQAVVLEYRVSYEGNNS
jgi:riboflavin biosynthesis pyrimidine reductase